MSKLTRADITTAVAEELNMTNRDVDRVICACFEYIAKNMAHGHRISVNNFGTFEPRTRAARSGTNPRTKEPIDIPSTIAPAFKPSLALKRAVTGAEAE